MNFENRLDEALDIEGTVPDEDRFQRIERLRWPVTNNMDEESILDNVFYYISSIAHDYGIKVNERLRRFWTSRVASVMNNAARSIHKWYGSPLNNIPFTVNALYTYDDERSGELELIITIEEEDS